MAEQGHEAGDAAPEFLLAKVTFQLPLGRHNSKNSTVTIYLFKNGEAEIQRDSITWPEPTSLHEGLHNSKFSLSDYKATGAPWIICSSLLQI